MNSAVSTVHTTGINWESVITIVGSIITILAVLGTFVAKYIAGKITGAIEQFQNAVVNKLDTRLSVVEAKLDNLNEVNPIRNKR